MTLTDAIARPGAAVIYTHPATGRKEYGELSHHGFTERGLIGVYYDETLILTHPANLTFDRKQQ
jgi:hypothetical protein